MGFIRFGPSVDPLGVAAHVLQRSSVRYVVSAYLVDMLLTMFALVAARWLRIVIPLGQPLTASGAALYWPMFAMALVIWSLTLSTFRTYDPARLTLWTDEAQQLIVAITVATVIYAGALYFTYRGLSRLLFIYFWLLDITLVLSARLVLRALLGQRSSGRRRVVIVGAGQVGRRVAEALRPAQWMGIEVVGYLDDAPAKQGQPIDDLPVLGCLDDARRIVAEQEVQEVIIALPMGAHARLSNLVAELGETTANIKVVPDYSQLVFLRTTMEDFGGLLLIGLKEPVIGPVDRTIKRAFDLVVASLALVLLSPLLAVVALLVRWSSPGPVLYRSRRVGEGGRPFDMLKFRTMYDGADRAEDALIQQAQDGQLVFDKRRDDPRVTPLGRFLRRYSLDELPQLYNVLRGDMSLVGPRPELPALVERYQPWQMKRFAVPQGITGWWQISGRSAKAKHLHVEDDLFYIRNYSVLLDVKILLRTPAAVIRGDGAF